MLKPEAAHGAISIAEAFLIAGVQHYICAFRCVDDNAAALSGDVLYGLLANCKTMGLSVIRPRKELANRRLPDWANQSHYGNPDAEPLSKSS